MKKLLIMLLFVIVFSIGCAKDSQQEPTDSTSSTTEDAPPVVVVEEEPVETTVYVRILADALNVRESHSLGSQVIGVLKENAIHERLEIYDAGNGKQWYRIETEDYIGWVAGWYCMDNDAYEDKVLRANLLAAFDGEIPSVKGAFKSTYDEIKSLYNNKLETTNYWGGPGLYNDSILYLFDDDGLILISVVPEVSIYGVAPGSTLEEVKTHLGEADSEITVDDPEGEGLYDDGSLVTSYITGSYVVKFVFDENQILSRIELSKHVL